MDYGISNMSLLNDIEMRRQVVHIYIGQNKKMPKHKSTCKGV